MRPIPMPPVPRATAIKIAILAAGLLVWVAPVPGLNISVRQAATPPASPSLPIDHPELAMHELTSRPLFAQSRRPPPPVAVVSTAVAKPVPTTNGMVLLGILRDPTHVVALVSLPGEVQARRVEQGGRLGEWIIKQISADRLLLRSGDTNAELVLPRPALTSTAASGPRFMPSYSRVP